MDITGQYFSSFSIKGQPFDEEFSIVLEASISVYDKSGALRTNIVSKLNSKPIVIKSMMKSNLKDGLDLSGVVFGKQVDEYKSEHVSGQLHGKCATVREKLDAIKQNEASTRRSTPVQKLRLDCFWAHLPDNYVESTRPSSPVQTSQTGTNDNSTGISVSNNGNLTADGSHLRRTTSQPFVLNASQTSNTFLDQMLRAAQMMNTNATKNKTQASDEMNIPHDSVENVFPNGLSYVIKQETMETMSSRDGVPDISRETGYDTAAANEALVNACKNIYYSVPDRNTNSSIIQTDGDTKSFQVKFKINNFEKENETSQTERNGDDTSTPLRTVNLDHAYKRAKQMKVVKGLHGKVGSPRKHGKVGRPRKNSNEAKQKSPMKKGKKQVGSTRKTTIQNVTCDDNTLNEEEQGKSKECNKKAKGSRLPKEHEETNTFDMSSVEIKTEKNDSDIEREDNEGRLEENSTSDKINSKKAKRPRLPMEHEETNTFDMSSVEIKIEKAESNIESGDNDRRRKRRRCTRNVNYKALAKTFETDESEKDDSDRELSYSDMDFDEPGDSDYKEPNDSGASEREESTDEEEPEVLGLDEDKEAKILEQIDKKKKKQVKKKQKKTVEKIKVIVNLSEHEDKFEIVKFISSEQRNRGKPIDEISHDSYACKICKEFEVGDKEYMSLHIGQHLQGILRCKHCEIEFPSHGLKIEHDRVEHPYEFANRGAVCEQCGKMFVSKRSRCCHMYKVHKTPSFECSLCTKQGNIDAEKFAMPKDIYSHEREKHFEDIFICRKCDVHFVHAPKYTLHVTKCTKDKTSSESQMVQCSMCSFTCSIRQSLCAHVRRVHRKEKNSKCELCDFKAFTQHGVRRHMAHAHLGKKSIIFVLFIDLHRL